MSKKKLYNIIKRKVLLFPLFKFPIVLILIRTVIAPLNFRARAI